MLKKRGIIKIVINNISNCLTIIIITIIIIIIITNIIIRKATHIGKVVRLSLLYHIPNSSSSK
jgi:hypothetical protein